jgi:membrane protein implicated in regulation of membrane protease activity
MPWWSWMILGALLLGAELLAIDAGFYLVFIGLAAALTGLVELIVPELDPWIQWVLFSVFAIILMVFFRKKLYEKLRGSGVGYDGSATGETVVAVETLVPGGKGRLSHRGTDWTVINTSSSTIEKGQQVLITGIKGLSLTLNTIENNQE